MTPTTLFLLIATTWRVSSLVANESGPFGMFEKFRTWCERMCESNRLCGAFHLYEGVQCEWCNSIWIGTLLTVLLAPFLHLSLPELLGLPLTLSTGTIVIKYTVHTLDNLQSRLYAERVAQENPHPHKRKYISS